MHLIITDAWLARSRAIHLTGTRLMVTGLAVSFSLMLIAAGLYHWVFLVVKDEFDQRDRFLRENIDAMARQVGEMQAKMMQLESLGERVSGLAGVNPGDIKVSPGRGGALISGPSLSLEELQVILSELERTGSQRSDLLTLMESRLFDQKIGKSLVPTQKPVSGVSLGSAFGWRIDPITGRSALHTGLDFSADAGTPIMAAAGGVVVAQEYHFAYGNMIEIDHGNNLLSRYAHASRVFVKKGDLIKRGQKIAEVGSTGRSTGSHLHFEVLVQGVFQDPQKFLAAGENLPTQQVAKAVASAEVPHLSRR